MKAELHKPSFLTSVTLGRHSLLAKLQESGRPLASLWPVFQLIDGLQVLYLICGPRVQRNWDFSLWQYLIAVGKNLSAADPETSAFTVAVGVFAAELFFLALTALLIWLHRPLLGKKPTSGTLIALLVRVLLGYMLLLQAGMLTYLFEMAFSQMFCNQGTCGTQQTNLAPPLIVASILVLLTQVWLIYPASIELNPFLGGGSSQFHTKVSFWKTVSRIILAFLYVLLLGVDFVEAGINENVDILLLGAPHPYYSGHLPFDCTSKRIICLLRDHARQRHDTDRDFDGFYAPNHLPHSREDFEP